MIHLLVLWMILSKSLSDLLSRWFIFFFFFSKYYNSAQRSNRLQSRKQVAIGDFGVTQFGEDNSWYRARVVSHEENDQIKVLDIDSGNLESKFIDEFFPLDRKFADLPTQAIACTLSQVGLELCFQMKIKTIDLLIIFFRLVHQAILKKVHYGHKKQLIFFEGKSQIESLKSNLINPSLVLKHG